MSSPDVERPSAPQAKLTLADVRIQDFRGLRDLCTTLDPLTVVIGENNAGKTSFLQGLAVLFGPNRPSHDDFYVGQDGMRSEHFMIDVRLRPSEGADFDDGMRARFKGAIQFADASCDSEYVVLRGTGRVDAVGGGVSLERRFLKGWASSRPEAAKLEVLPDHVGTQHLELVAFFLLDAKRDLVEELRVRNSHWGRLLSELEIASSARAEIEKQLDELSREIIASSPILADITRELQTVRDALTSSISEVAISPLPGRVEEVARGVDVLLKPPSGTPLPMRLHGQGARSPYVVRVVDDIHSIRLLRRTPSGTIGCNRVPKKANGAATFTPADLVQVHKFVLRNNAEALFARLVVIFEGDTEDLAFPVFARHHWQKDHAALGVSFAKTDGAGSGKHVAVLLHHLEIPWVMFADGDSASKKAILALEKALDRKLTEHELVLRSWRGAGST